MKIAIVATHSFPIPPPTHTGDVVILDLALALDEMGHEILLCAPEGTTIPPHGRLLPMPSSAGKAYPSAEECERRCLLDHYAALSSADVIHDFSITKAIAEEFLVRGRPATVSTALGGNWAHPRPPLNVCVWSEAMRGRALCGVTDYEGTPTPDLAGPSFPPIKDARVVPGGVDTDWYHPGVEKEDFVLWMNRWHPAKGYALAIEVARAMPKQQFVMAGEHPDREMFEYQRACALDAVRLAEGLANVRFEWLPADPDHHIAKRALYQRAKALLYSVQFQEPFGLSQVEALACGTPVIGTRFGSVPEVIENERTGFVCDNSVESISAAITWADTLSVRDCWIAARVRFDRRVMARNYLAAYEDAIAGRIWGA